MIDVECSPGFGWIVLFLRVGTSSTRGHRFNIGGK